MDRDGVPEKEQGGRFHRGYFRAELVPPVDGDLVCADLSPHDFIEGVGGSPGSLPKAFLVARLYPGNAPPGLCNYPGASFRSYSLHVDPYPADRDASAWQVHPFGFSSVGSGWLTPNGIAA